MPCPICSLRKPRRSCPAVGQVICTVCCGTKRLIEIDCPPTCSYLAASREHPAAAVRRLQERDLSLLLPSIHHLSERQNQLFFLFHSLIARYQPDGLARLLDGDVAEAAAAVASTFETAAKGVIYEHTPSTLPAQRLAAELATMVQEMRKQGTTVYDGEVAVTLRAIERGARDVADSGPTSYLDLMGRLLQVNRAARQGSQSSPSGTGSILLP